MTRLGFSITHTKLLVCYATVGKVLCVCADKLSSGISLSRSDIGDLYTSASLIKFSAGRRVTQFGFKSDSRHILPEKQNKTHALICAHTGMHLGD